MAEELFILSAEDRAELIRLLNWTRALRGPGVRNSPWGATISNPASINRPSSSTSLPPVRGFYKVLQSVSATGDEAAAIPTNIAWDYLRFPPVLADDPT